MTVWICFQRFTDITGKLEAVPGGQYHLVPWKLFYRKVFMTKLLLYLKLTVWIRFWWSLDIRGKLGADPGGQHYLDPQENVLKKS